VVGEAVEERRCHLGVAEDCGPFAEGEVGGDDDRRLFVEPADPVEEELAADLGEGQVAELIQDRGGSRNGAAGAVEEVDLLGQAVSVRS
jgi:hypothetical protein